MTGLAVAVVALPLLAAAVGLVPVRLLAGRRAEPSTVSISAITALAGTGLATLLLAPLWFVTIWQPTQVRELTARLTPTGTIDIAVGVRVDGLSATVAVLVCVVALAVQVYSVGYMRNEPRYRSYAAFVSLFTGAMLLVVFASDLIVLLVGWEVMGLCSYVLIGHHWERVDFSRAGVKAFLVTKLGDVPFMFGIFALGVAAESFRVSDVLAAAAEMNQLTVTVGTLLLLGGVVGKSAQFPLQTWLPDAMAGPTPVSALIHAATMVAAGAYLVARLYPVFLQSPTALAVLGVVAAITMFTAACAAFAQDDLKRVLAYSTVSQVAYMQAGLAMGGYAAGVEHLLTHGAFKAVLFLAAGAVILRVGTNLMSEMGGLYRVMPITYTCMLVGFAALVGVPPTSGFFSKDAVLEQSLHQLTAPQPLVPQSVAGVVLVAGALTAFMTAAYAARTVLLTFHGPRRTDVASGGDPELGMLVPMLVLSVPSLSLGLFGVHEGWLPSWFASADTGTPHAVLPGALTAVLSFVLVVVGVAVVYFAWVPHPERDPVRLVEPVRPLFARGFFVDDLYELVFVRGTAALGRAVVRLDTDGVDATVSDSGRLMGWLGALARRTQTGNAQWYVTGVVIGAVALAVGAVVLV
ncbi:MAG: NADH-quinone oxidoreductase subunit L [Streptosporangiales bacterium]|nr:NADH-quinone oxidoreductase subunit L [Streptosporangiales bacterium]